MPLTLMSPGEDAIIQRIGGKPEVRQHLENLGFVVGGNVSVINTIGGNLIVNVKEARVAISPRNGTEDHGLIPGAICSGSLTSIICNALQKRRRFR